MEYLFDNINTFDAGSIVVSECLDVTYLKLVALGLAS